VLEHVLDEIDAPARPIELVAELEIGRASRVAEAAMDAAAQDLVGFLRVRIRQLREGKARLLASVPIRKFESFESGTFELPDR
jgi:hypothetical protein